MTIHHIQITSVRELVAKPIVYIMPKMKYVDKKDPFYENFILASYECMDESELPVDDLIVKAATTIRIRYIFLR